MSIVLFDYLFHTIIGIAIDYAPGSGSAHYTIGLAVILIPFVMGSIGLLAINKLRAKE